MRINLPESADHRDCSRLCATRRGIWPLGTLALAILTGCGEAAKPNGPGLGGRHYAADASALSDIVVDLRSKSPEVRSRAAATLGGLGPAAKLAVADLITALKDADLGVRQAAAFALGRIGPDARDALPALRSLAQKGPASAVAAKAVERIDQK